MSRRARKLLAVSAIRSAVEPLKHLLGELAETGAEAVAVVGDLGLPSSRSDTYRAIFKALGEARRPAFWVPGPMDAPLRDYLRESYNLEIVYPSLHAVHGSVAVGPDDVVFAGMGGEIVDDPDDLGSQEWLLRYPGWEVEYRLKAIREFENREKVFLFTTPPAHKGLRHHGSELVAELIKSHSPRIAIVAGEHARQEQLGGTLVVCPGRFDRGDYALVDLRGRWVEPATLPQTLARPF